MARLTVTTQLEPKALERMVPPFIIQPLVENAIRHAVDASPEGGSISVRAFLRGNWLVVEVVDSGTGADPEALWNAAGVGLRGVRTQLTAHFGEDAKMEADTDPGGFTVRLVLPPLDE
jgi:sensor histidine kinase YesM